MVFRMSFYFVKIFPHRPKNQDRALGPFDQGPLLSSEREKLGRGL
jgi:hypothetical protein